PEPELFWLFVRPLNQAGIRYVVSGSVAAIFYGEPRLTHDVDFIVFLKVSDAKRLGEIFPVSHFYVPPMETLLSEIGREKNGHFNLIHLETSFKADLYLTGNDELNAWAFRSQRKINFDGENIAIASPEYVIVRKLEYFREGGSEKHLRDIRSMLAVSGEQIDRSVLNEWIAKYELEIQWQKVSE
ncbi:MAG: hypothetical protein ACR2H1_00075, partial [Limisphaerales bacterium]